MIRPVFPDGNLINSTIEINTEHSALNRELPIAGDFTENQPVSNNVTFRMPALPTPEMDYEPELRDVIFQKKQEALRLRFPDIRNPLIGPHPNFALAQIENQHAPPFDRSGEGHPQVIVNFNGSNSGDVPIIAGDRNMASRNVMQNYIVELATTQEQIKKIQPGLDSLAELSELLKSRNGDFSAYTEAEQRRFEQITALVKRGAIDPDLAEIKANISTILETVNPQALEQNMMNATNQQMIIKRISQFQEDDERINSFVAEIIRKGRTFEEILDQEQRYFHENPSLEFQLKQKLVMAYLTNALHSSNPEIQSVLKSIFEDGDMTRLKEKLKEEIKSSMMEIQDEFFSKILSELGIPPPTDDSISSASALYSYIAENRVFSDAYLEKISQLIKIASSRSEEEIENDPRLKRLNQLFAMQTTQLTAFEEKTAGRFQGLMDLNVQYLQESIKMNQIVLANAESKKRAEKFQENLNSERQNQQETNKEQEPVHMYAEDPVDEENFSFSDPQAGHRVTSDILKDYFNSLQRVGKFSVFVFDAARFTNSEMMEIQNHPDIQKKISYLALLGRRRSLAKSMAEKEVISCLVAIWETEIDELKMIQMREILKRREPGENQEGALREAIKRTNHAQNALKQKKQILFLISKSLFKGNLSNPEIADEITRLKNFVNDRVVLSESFVGDVEELNPGFKEAYIRPGMKSTSAPIPESMPEPIPEPIPEAIPKAQSKMEAEPEAEREEEEEAKPSEISGEEIVQTLLQTEGADSDKIEILASIPESEIKSSERQLQEIKTTFDILSLSMQEQLNRSLEAMNTSMRDRLRYQETLLDETKAKVEKIINLTDISSIAGGSINEILLPFQEKLASTEQKIANIVDQVEEKQGKIEEVTGKIEENSKQIEILNASIQAVNDSINASIDNINQTMAAAQKEIKTSTDAQMNQTLQDVQDSVNAVIVLHNQMSETVDNTKQAVNLAFAAQATEIATLNASHQQEFTTALSHVNNAMQEIKETQIQINTTVEDLSSINRSSIMMMNSPHGLSSKIYASQPMLSNIPEDAEIQNASINEEKEDINSKAPSFVPIQLQVRTKPGEIGLVRLQDTSHGAQVLRMEDTASINESIRNPLNATVQNVVDPYINQQIEKSGISPDLSESSINPGVIRPLPRPNMHSKTPSNQQIMQPRTPDTLPPPPPSISNESFKSIFGRPAPLSPAEEQEANENTLRSAWGRFRDSSEDSQFFQKTIISDLIELLNSESADSKEIFQDQMNDIKTKIEENMFLKDEEKDRLFQLADFQSEYWRLADEKQFDLSRNFISQEGENIAKGLKINDTLNRYLNNAEVSIEEEDYENTAKSLQEFSKDSLLSMKEEEEDEEEIETRQPSIQEMFDFSDQFLTTPFDFSHQLSKIKENRNNFMKSIKPYLQPSKLHEANSFFVKAQDIIARRNFNLLLDNLKHSTIPAERNFGTFLDDYAELERNYKFTSRAAENEELKLIVKQYDEDEDKESANENISTLVTVFMQQAESEAEENTLDLAANAISQFKGVLKESRSISSKYNAILSRFNEKLDSFFSMANLDDITESFQSSTSSTSSQKDKLWGHGVNIESKKRKRHTMKFDQVLPSFLPFEKNRKWNFSNFMEVINKIKKHFFISKASLQDSNILELQRIVANVCLPEPFKKFKNRLMLYASLFAFKVISTCTEAQQKKLIPFFTCTSPTDMFLIFQNPDFQKSPFYESVVSDFFKSISIGKLFNIMALFGS